MSKKGNVSWVKPAEPSFLRKFKNDVGFKEGPTVDTKRQQLPTAEDDSGDSEREDEMPQVVVLKEGHLTAEEAKNIKAKMKTAEEEERPLPDGKILFKKPTKRSSEKIQGLFTTSSKKKKAKEAKGKEDSAQKKVKNSSLLSFGRDEDEDEDN
ncbi:hypothetical protein GN956_G4228 [Arapaima gigas]